MNIKKLVVVESPSKTKKIASFLGSDYEVVSSVGHIRDLPKSSFGVDVEKSYEPQYVVSDEKKDVVKDLRKRAKTSDEIYLATDEDREGEAIAWHVGYVINNDSYLGETDAESNFLNATKLKKKNGEFPKVYRVTFNSITKEAVLEAFNSPRKLNQNLVDAQQARRILDRLVGYKLSPVLWEKIRYGLSAGRVQSVAVRFIVEREREIKNFAKAPYFEIEGSFSENNSKNDSFKAHLSKIDEKNIYVKKEYKLFAGDYSTYGTTIDSENRAEEIKSDLEKHEYEVAKITKKESKSHPSAPFSTSSMQQSASTNLGYSPARTMQIAQKLYEAGYITYMRTDSVHIEPSIVNQIRSYVKSAYGERYLNPSLRDFKSKKEIKTQEAHEAIRPTDIKFTPDKLPKSVNPQQKKLYELIWSRTIATQMTPAIYQNAKVQISNKSGTTKYTFEIDGSIRTFDGFLKVTDGGKKDFQIPDLKEGQTLNLLMIDAIAKELNPPPRYNESSLVKALENFNIGRPSTYASIVSTIQTRGYVAKEEKALYPTDNGIVVNDLLVNHFPVVVDVNFTSRMEDDLDSVALGNKSWINLMDEFYPSFASLVDTKKKEIKKEDVVILEKTDIECPECKQGKLIVKLGKYGRFYSCDRFPECMHMDSVPDERSKGESGEEGEESISKEASHPCPLCAGKLILKQGRFGKFYACENYPKCKHTEPILNKIGMKCPKCGEAEGGEVVSKKTKRQRIFYGCSRYPACDFASWTRPDLESAKADKPKSKAKGKGKATGTRKKATKAKKA